jgi:hypothetical protein
MAVLPVAWGTPRFPRHRTGDKVAVTASLVQPP